MGSAICAAVGVGHARQPQSQDSTDILDAELFLSILPFIFIYFIFKFLYFIPPYFMLLYTSILVQILYDLNQ